jgi:hypothetical protein
MTTVNLREIHKLTPTYNKLVSSSGKMLERSYLLVYNGPRDAMALANDLSQLKYFEMAIVNRILEKEYHGTKIFEPGSSTRFED